MSSLLPLKCPVVLDSNFMDNPHETYRRAFEFYPEQPVEVILADPVAYLPAGLRGWMITDYNQISEALQDPRFKKDIRAATDIFKRSAPSNGRNESPGRGKILYDNMANNDTPSHTRMRKPFNSAFTPRKVESLRPRLREIANDLLRELDAAEGFDLVSQYALPFSIHAICELLGVPISDWEFFKGWADVITNTSKDEDLKVATDHMAEYLVDLVSSKMESGGSDVVSQVLGEQGVNELSREEMAAQVYALLVAGYKSTANIITSSFYSLNSLNFGHGSTLDDIAELDLNVDELMRHESPFNLSLFRYTSQPVMVGNITIPANAIVFFAYAAANRDAKKFANPDVIDFDRDASSHLSFGYGRHNCIGKHFARAELSVALTQLLLAFPALTILRDPISTDWSRSVIFRGLDRLQVGHGSTTPSWRDND